MVKKRKVADTSLNPSPQSSPPAKVVETKAAYASVVKEGTFGKETKDSQPVFEIRFADPGAPVKIIEVIKEVQRADKSSLFGVRHHGADLVASFHEKKERDSIVSRGSIKVSGKTVTVSPFPLPARKEYKYFLQGVPMSATASAVGKALESLEAGRHYFETYQGTSVRTGRVIFWSANPKPPATVRVNDAKVSVKIPGSGKPQPPKADEGEGHKEEAKEEKPARAGQPPAAIKQQKVEDERKREDRQPGQFDFTFTPVTEGAAEAQHMLVDPHPTTPMKPTIAQISPLSPKAPAKGDKKDPLLGEAPLVDRNFLEQLGFEMTGKNAVLSIYEDLEQPSDALAISSKVPSPVGKVTKQQIALPRDSAGKKKLDLFNLNVIEVDNDKDGYQRLNDHYTQIGLDREAKKDLTKLRWVQEVVLGEGQVILVLFKSRILRLREGKK